MKDTERLIMALDCCAIPTCEIFMLRNPDIVIPIFGLPKNIFDELKLHVKIFGYDVERIFKM